MGSTPVLLRNAIDVYISSRSPNSAVGTSSRLLSVYNNNVTGFSHQSLIYYSLPFPMGSTIMSAKLRMVQAVNHVGSKTVNVQRIASAWSASRVTWNNSPANTGSIVTVTKSGTPEGTVWEWDVTALLQTVSNGAAWYGFCLEANSGTLDPCEFWSSSVDDYLDRPVLEVTWKDNPQKPSRLSPSAGREVSLNKPILQCDFTDYSGDTSMAGIHVRIFSTLANANAQTPIEFDSGTVATSVPELNLSTTAYGGIADGATRWWRVRTQDGAGLWSDWSDPAEFGRTTKGTLTITNPSGTTISDATFPVTWTFTGRTQKAYQIILASSTYPALPLWTSGKITSTATSLTIPAGAIRESSASYVFIVRVWDTIDREGTPNDPVYTEATKNLSFVYDAATGAVTSLVGTPDSIYGDMVLTWNRASMPDKWDIYRDGKVLASVSGSSLWLSGTSYKYTDLLPQPRKQSTWTVVPVVNGLGAATNPTVVATVTPKTFVLTDTLGNNPVLLFNPQHEMALDVTSAVHTPVGDGIPVLLTQGERGYVGSVTASIEENPLVPALSAQQWRDRFLALTKNNGAPLCMTMIDRSFLCFVDKVNITPRVNSICLYYEVSFDFYQTDWVE